MIILFNWQQIKAEFRWGFCQPVVIFPLDGPRFPDDQPLIFAGAIGEPLKMGCFAEGNPKPQVEWRWAGSAGFSAVLTRSEYHIRPSIQAQDFGNYICTAKSPGFPPASRKIILAQKCMQQRLGSQTFRMGKIRIYLTFFKTIGTISHAKHWTSVFWR